LIELTLILKNFFDYVQFDSNNIDRWCKANQLVKSMSHREKCWNTAVAKSFFSNLSLLASLSPLIFMQLKTKS